MPIPPKGSIPRRKPRGRSSSDAGLDNLLGGLLKGLGKTIESIQNLNLEDLEKLVETHGNEEAKEKIAELKKRLGKLDEKGTRSKPPPKTEKPTLEKVEAQEPEMEVYPEEKQIRVIGEMPGVEEENITCEVRERGTILSISAEGRKRYAREVELPSPVTKKVSWSYKNGVLEVILTKKQG